MASGPLGVRQEAWRQDCDFSVRSRVGRRCHARHAVELEVEVLAKWRSDQLSFLVRGAARVDQPTVQGRLERRDGGALGDVDA